MAARGRNLRKRGCRSRSLGVNTDPRVPPAPFPVPTSCRTIAPIVSRCPVLRATDHAMRYPALLQSQTSNLFVLFCAIHNL